MSDAERGSSSSSRPAVQGGVNEASSNPLFGASPPQDASSTSTQAPPNLGSTPAIDSAARGDNGDSGAYAEGTTNPLFGATPYNGNVTGSGLGHDVGRSPTPRQYVLQHGPSSGRSPLSLIPGTKTLTFIRRITFVLSLFLGISASIAGIWSYFILPLLHSSFSARKVLVDQQLPRVKALLEGLRRLRGGKIYPRPLSQAKKEDVDGQTKEKQDPSRDEDSESRGENTRPRKGNDEKRTSGDEEGPQHTPTRPSQPRREASLKEITSLSSSLIFTPSSPPSSSSSSTESPTAPAAELPLLPTAPLHTLSAKLRELSTALEGTSTTRTSLISTLESYTSHLHREMFVSRPHQSYSSGYSGSGINRNPHGGFGGYSIGGTLGSNLSKAGAGAGAGAGGGITGLGGGVGAGGELAQFSGKEDWDKVRKEIRAIKGVLLNRRSFTPRGAPSTPVGSG